MSPTSPRSSRSSSPQDPGGPRVLVVGAGNHFLSAMSHYTVRLTNALATRHRVAVLPMRRLLPKFLYPGRSRVGLTPTWVDYTDTVIKLREVDWFWFPSLLGAIRDLRRWRPDCVIFEWWTGTVVHTYLALAIAARLIGASVIVEFHEIQDTGEARIPFAKHWVSLLGRLCLRTSAAFIIHSESDRDPLYARYGLRSTSCLVIPHGPLDHFSVGSSYAPPTIAARRAAPRGCVNLLFFGVIRPFKGLEDLIRAFDMLHPDEVERYWLTVVGEVWEGWDLPLRLIDASRYRSRITLVDRFVSDDEVVAYFAGADAVVLPYHRSSASAPAHVTMSNGLPLVITSVGGLPTAVEHYEGALQVPPHDPSALRDSIRQLWALRHKRFADPHSWERTVLQYEDAFKLVGVLR